MKKSTTQMTKTELIQLLRDKEVIIANLNVQVDELQRLAIASEATPMDADSSNMITSLKAQVASLENDLMSARGGF